jgi:hypothetical protein
MEPEQWFLVRFKNGRPEIISKFSENREEIEHLLPFTPKGPIAGTVRLCKTMADVSVGAGFDTATKFRNPENES